MLGPLNCLVIGGDSRIGAPLVQQLIADGHDAHGTTRQTKESANFFLDLEKPIWRHRAPGVAYFVAGITRFADCEADPILASLVNYSAPLSLARQFAEDGARIVLCSSSAAETHCDSVYGRLQFKLAQEFISEFVESAAVVRFGPVNFIGRSAYPDGQYQPVSLNFLLRELSELASNWIPGLHRIFCERKHTVAVPGVLSPIVSVAAA